MSSASSTSTSPIRASGAAATRSRRQNVDYGVRNQLMAQLNRREFYGLDVYRWEDDDLSLRSAAAQARLPYDRMTLRELELFPEMARSQPSAALFLYVRNRTLVQWHLDPLVELTVESIQEELPEPFNSDFELVKGVHSYLERYGYINCGVFRPLKKRKLDKSLRVVVVGAGAAGLAAARQLNFFGFEVVVLEAAARTCGRAVTFRARADLPPADLGAMVIMGIVGNPLVMLVQQNPCSVVRMNHKCPIYDHEGKLVEKRKDDMIQKSFNRILSTISYIVHGMGITEIDGGGSTARSSKSKRSQKLSLGRAFRLILNQQELRVKKRRFNYWSKYKELCTRSKDAIEKIRICRTAIDECLSNFRASGIQSLAEANAEMFSINFDGNLSGEEFDRRVSLRCLRKCLKMSIKALEEANRERQEIDEVLKEYTRMEPSFVFMNNIDKRILDFHLANLEYGIGAPLKNVALKDWDQDDPYGFAGSHMTVKEGLGFLIGRLGNELDVRTNCVVEKIMYNEKGVEVAYSSKKVFTNGANKMKEKTSFCSIKADAVLCTVPLGVLKRTPPPSEDEIIETGAIRFEPSLPLWKFEAIANMGFGSLNKLILFFEKPFWDTTKCSFGRTNDTPGSRGELFLFYSNGDLPFLSGLFAGESAAITGQLTGQVIVQKAMDALRKIFGNNIPLEPIDYVLTKWHQEQFARGCYSFMSTSSSPDDYDKLARPLHPANNEKMPPRVFFAGEHTNRRYPSSVHGAFLSGLREAARIADTFLGVIPQIGEIDATTANQLVSECQSQLNIQENKDKPGTSETTSNKNQHQEKITNIKANRKGSGGGGGGGASSSSTTNNATTSTSKS